MSDIARTKVFEAEHYIEDAAARAEREDDYSPSVAISHATDAIILAVDALCHSRNVPVPKRHDQAQVAFLGMIRQGQIPEDASRWREFLSKAHSQRSSFQYDGALTSRSDAKRFVRQAAEFVEYVRGILAP